MEWALQWGGDQEDLAADIILEPSGNFAYVTGSFQSTKFKLDAFNVLTPNGVVEEADDDVAWGNDDLGDGAFAYVRCANDGVAWV